MLAPVLVTAPTADLLSLDEVRAQCRVDGDDEDELLKAYIAAVTGHLDGWAGILGRALVTQTWSVSRRCFEDRMRLPLAPVSAIVSVKYQDADDTEQTLASGNYGLLSDGLGPYVYRQPTGAWPGAYSRANAVTITFTAGYGAASNVPRPIRQAALMLVAHWYENREPAVIGTSVADLPLSVSMLLAPYRRPIL